MSHMRKPARTAASHALQSWWRELEEREKHFYAGFVIGVFSGVLACTFGFFVAGVL